jgi:hypothetical protein
VSRGPTYVHRTPAEILPDDLLLTAIDGLSADGLTRVEIREALTTPRAQGQTLPPPFQARPAPRSKWTRSGEISRSLVSDRDDSAIPARDPITDPAIDDPSIPPAFRAYARELERGLQCLSSGRDDGQSSALRALAPLWAYSQADRVSADNRQRGSLHRSPCKVRSRGIVSWAQQIQSGISAHDTIDASLIALSAAWKRSRGKRAKAIRQQARAFAKDKGIGWNSVSYMFRAQYRAMEETTD